MNVAIIVLGDVGRSPRMQYHAVSASKLNTVAHVDLIGYDEGNAATPAVLQRPNVTIRYIRPPFAHLKRGERVPFVQRFFVTRAAVKVILQTWRLFYMLLFTIASPDFMIVQNPPAIPTLLIVWLACCWHRSTMIVDWHNYGFTLLELGFRAKRADGQLGALQRVVVAVARWYEGVFGRRAHRHLCVTDAMRVDLEERWSIDAVTLHDCAPSFFKETSVADAHSLFLRLRAQFEQEEQREWFTQDNGAPRLTEYYEDNTATPFTRRHGRTVRRRTDRPALIVSSTSWTRDEDFSPLCDALLALQRHFDSKSKRKAKEGDALRAVVLVTGKGELRAHYMRRLHSLGLRNICVYSLWLESADYPRLLGAADLGLSFHQSSSGLDLPMKVVDMFGCALPVCAVDFTCLHELVIDGRNGLVFRSGAELGDHLCTLLGDFPEHCDLLDSMQDYLRTEGKRGRWRENWQRNAAPLLSLKTH